jgi:hypothetical protein
MSPRRTASHDDVVQAGVHYGEENKGGEMARYGKAASESVKNAVHREKRGELRSGKNGKGGVVKSREQAIAIGLSEARKRGANVPTKKTS